MYTIKDLNNMQRMVKQELETFDLETLIKECVLYNNVELILDSIKLSKQCNDILYALNIYNDLKEPEKLDYSIQNKLMNLGLEYNIDNID
jgi:hypothetical protein